MKAIIAKAKAQEGKEAEFQQVALEMAAAVKANEPGNQLYRLGRTPSGEFLFVELYDDDEAMTAHSSAPHMMEIGPRLFGLMDGQPEMMIADIVDE